MVSLTTILISAAAFAVYYFLFRKDSNKKLPPGPFAWPIIGNALALKKGIHHQVGTWRKKYGDIFSFHLGNSRVVVLSEFKHMKEAFNDPNISSRPDLESFNILSDGPHGVLNASGDVWVEQRRFTLRHLRDFGFGKNYLESTIMEEVNELLDALKKLEGQSVNISRKFSLAVLNSLWQILSSKRYKQDDPKLLNIFLQNNSITEDLGSSPALLLPSVAKLAPEFSGWNRVLKLVKEMQSVVVDSIEEHKKTFPEDGNPRDFIDAYLNEVKATTNPNSSFYKEQGEISLKAVIGDLFGAGSETTSNTLNWTILYMCKYQHIQKKVQQEIDAVIGKNRQPALDDRPNMPYCVATMEETLRYSTLVPIGLFHVASTDIKFHGYDIPKGSWVVANFHGIHFNPANFENPTEFNPDRFLSRTNGKTVFKKNEAMVAFSNGKRACLGETLARDEYWLFFTSLFQKFSIELAPESKDVTVEPNSGFILQAKKFNVVMRERLE